MFSTFVATLSKKTKQLRFGKTGNKKVSVVRNRVDKPTLDSCFFSACLGLPP